jgi:RHS repeat-associated protein
MTVLRSLLGNLRRFTSRQGRRRAVRSSLRRTRRLTAAALGPVLTAGTAIMPVAVPVAAATAVAAGITAASVAKAPAAKAATTGPVLVLLQNGETTAPEATILSNAGYSVTVATPSTWQGMSASQFETYAALVIGDPSSGGTCSTLIPTAGSSGSEPLGATWQGAVSGNMAVLGTAPALPGSTAASTLITDAVASAAAGFNSAASGTPTSGTGLYVSLNCEYSTAAAGTSVPLLAGVDNIGTGLTVQGGLACTDPGTVNTWEAASAGTFGGFSSTSLAASSWTPGCPVQEAFTAWPAMFTPVAYDSAADATANFTASDGITGQPYVLLGSPISSATASLAPSAGGEVLAGTTSGGTSNPAAPGVMQASAGDPVNTENGDFTQDATDASIPTFGPGLGFTRTYDAGVAQQQTEAGTPGPLGYGWTDNWATSLSGFRPTPGDIYAAAGLRTDNGDGGASANSIVSLPGDEYVDGSGDVYFADTWDNRIQEVAGFTGTQWGQSMIAGDVYTVAGNPAGTIPEFNTGNGLNALQMGLNHPSAVTVNSSGMFIADTQDCRIVEVAATTGTQWGISMTADDAYTIAGNGSCGYSGDNGPAVNAQLSEITSIHFGASGHGGDLYIADDGNNRIREIAGANESEWNISMTSGDIYTVVGTGNGSTFQTTKEPALSANISDPQGVTIDGNGDMLIADTGFCRIAEVPASSGTYWSISISADQLATVAGRGGTNNCTIGNDNKAATMSNLWAPSAVRDPNGTMYIADTDNNRIQTVTSGGTVNTLAGSSTGSGGSGGNGGSATSALLSLPTGLWIDSSGNVYIGDTHNNQVREISGGIISGLAGDQTPYVLTDDGDNGPALTSALSDPQAVASDADGDVFIADALNNRVQEIAASAHTQFGIQMFAGDVYTVAGSSTGVSSAFGSFGDGGLATSALMSDPEGLAVDAAGNLYIADYGDAGVRKVSAATGDISTIAGTLGESGNSGNGGPATSATLGNPAAVAVDKQGDVFIDDPTNNDVLEVPAAAGNQYGIAMTAGDIYAIAGGGILAAPTGLTVTGTTSSSVSLAWTAPSGTVTGYDVYENGTQVTTATGTSVTVTGLSPSTTYNFTVAAYNSLGTGPQSSSVQGTTSCSSGCAPGAPTGLTVTGTTSTTVSLSWTAPSGTVTGYDVYQNGTQVTTATGTTATVSGLSPSTTYTFTVAAYNSSGTGPQSSSVQGTTSSSGGGGAPAAPTGLTVNAIDATSVILSWTAPSGTVTGYDVYSSGTQVGSVTGTTVTLTGLSASTKYTFTVAAYNSSGTGAQSSSVQPTTSATSPSGAPTVTITGVTSSSVSLSWNSVSGAEGYFVYVNGTEHSATGSTTYTDSGLTASTTYTFNVAAEGFFGLATSATVTATTFGSSGGGGMVHLAALFRSDRPAAPAAGSHAAVVSQIAGSKGNSGDGGPSTAAQLNGPEGLAVDSAGNVYISDSGNNQIREIARAAGTQHGQSMTAGYIYTIAGSAAGTSGDSGDLGPATAALLTSPQQIALDAAGDLYVDDEGDNRVREIAAANGSQWSQSMTAADIYNVAGTESGTEGETGNGNPATSAQIAFPYGLGTDPAGDLYLLQFGVMQQISQLQVVAATSTPAIPAAPGTASSLSPAPGGFTVTQSGGAQVNFQVTGSGGGCPAPYVQAGQYCALPQDADATLTENSNGTYTFSPGPGADSYTYNSLAATTAPGQLASDTDMAGNILNVNYLSPSPGSGGCPSTATSCETITSASGRALVIGSTTSSGVSQITSVTDPMGRTWLYAYNSANDLTSATDPLGHVTSYTYGQGSTGNPLLANDLLTITGPNAQPGGPDAGDATVNVYDALGRVTSQTDPMGFKTTFNYCVNLAAGNCMNPATGTGYVTITDPDNNTTVDSYNDGTLAAESQFTAGAITSENDYKPLTWAGIANGGTLLDISTTDGDGNTTSYTYSATGATTSATTSGPAGPATTTASVTGQDQNNCGGAPEASSSSTCLQDAGPSPVAPGGVITPPSAAPPEGLTYILYDTRGNELYSTTGIYQPGSTSASYSQTTYQLFNGNTVTLNGSNISCTATAPSASLPCAKIGADGVVTQLGYDSAGDLSSSSTPDGNGTQAAVTTYAYDADGEATSTTAPDGNLSGANAGNYTTLTAYNADGQKTSVTLAGGSGATVTPRVTYYGYDPDGNPTTVQDARGYTTTTAYNADDKSTLVTDPDNNATLTCYDGDGNTVQTVPAVGVAANSLTAASCPASYPAGYGDRLASDATVSTFDVLGKVTQKNTPAPAGQSGSETTTYSYDGNGNLIQTNAPPTSNGGSSQVTVDTYTSKSQLASQTIGYGTSAASTTTYCYNPDGSQTAVVAPDGNASGTAPCETSSPWTVSPSANPTQAAYQTTYGFDSADEEVSTTTPATAAAPSGATTQYTYDPAGNMLTSLDPNGVTTTYTYTPASLKATVTYSGSSAHSVSYGYDADGSKTAMTDGTGSSSFIYDPFGELTSATNGAGQVTGYGYNADGQVSTVTYPLPASATWATSASVSYGYDIADRLTSVTDFNANKINIANTADGLPYTQALGSTGDTITATYDNTDAASALTLANSSSTLQSFTYSDAPAGNILSETDSPASPTSPAGYGYDAQGRVTSMVPGSGSPLNYGFDASGDLTTLPSGATGSYDKAGELTSSVLSGNTTSYTYSADGEQLTSVQSGTTVSSGSWNGAKQLTAYSNSAAALTAASYDGNGLRTSATITPAGGSATTQGYVWDSNGQVPALLMDSANAYIYGTSGTPAEQVNLSTGAITYLIADSLGSVRGAVSSSGTLAATASYDAWGNPETPGGMTAATPFGYAGGYTDPTGLLYLIDRYYNPVTGQFLSADPDLSQTQQPYLYAAGNPVSGTDPSGNMMIIGNDSISPDGAGGTANYLAGYSISYYLTKYIPFRPNLKMNCNWWNLCKEIGLVNSIAQPIISILFAEFAFGLLGPLVGAVISGLQYFGYADPKPKIGQLLRNTFKVFGWNLIVNVAINFVGSFLLKGMFEVLGKLAMKAADMIPGLGGLSFLGYYIQHALGYSAIGSHAAGGMAWMQRLFGV